MSGYEIPVPAAGWLVRARRRWSLHPQGGASVPSLRCLLAVATSSSSNEASSADEAASSAGETPPDDRCGYTHESKMLRGAGSVSCWRPAWEDEDHCIWHSDRGDKPRPAFEELAPEGHERLDGAHVANVSFDGVDWFEGCTLIDATLSDVDLRGASFVEADLRESSFEHVSASEADFTDANLEDATFSVCDLRGAILENARIDQTLFSNARISRDTMFGSTVCYEQELLGIDEEEEETTEHFRSNAEAAIWTYREIYNLYQDNALPFQAREFYLAEKNMRRRLAWRQNHYARALKAEGSRWVTGYGMSPWRVIASALLVIVGCGLLYPLTGGIQETIKTSTDSRAGRAVAVANETIGNATNATVRTPEQSETIIWSISDLAAASPQELLAVMMKSLYFSAITFTTLGYGDIQPVGNAARALAGMESLLGAMLTALLVFVLSQRIR